MNYAVYNIALDIHKTGSQVALSMIRGENKRKIVISLTENGRPYKIANGCTAVFSALKPDGNYIYNDCTVDIENNLIIYEVTSQTTAAMGEVKCQIELIGADGGLLFSPTFSLIVANKLYNQEPILASSEEFNALTAYLAELQQKLANGEFKGEKGDKGDVGPQGIQGIQGVKGNDGKDADVSELAPAIVCTEKGTSFTISDSSEAGFEGFSIYGRSTQKKTTGKNKIVYPYLDTNKTVDGITFAALGDGGVRVSGTATSGGAYFKLGGGYPQNKMPIPSWLVVGNSYTISGQKGNVLVELFLYNESGTGEKFSGTFTMPSGYVYYGIFVSVAVGNTADDTVYPMIRPASITDATYEQYTGGVPSPNPQYPQSITSIGDDKNVEISVGTETFIFADTLRAIPVTDSSFATYTDANGQMWCADEIDLERGVYIQRVLPINAGEQYWTINTTWSNVNDECSIAYFKNSNMQYGKFLCTHFTEYFRATGLGWTIGTMGMQENGVMYAAIPKLDANINDKFRQYMDDLGVVIYCAAITPIETPLSAEQIAAYKALKTSYPSTTILNDENAFMKVGYRADTKKFIQKMSGSTAQISSVTLAASKWVGTASPYSQVVTVPGATKNSKIDLNPTVAQLSIFHNKDLTFVVENDEGVITVYCIGQKPTNDYTMQATITEVYVNG